MTRHRWFHFALIPAASMIIACAPDSHESALVPSPNLPGWLVLEASDSLRTEIDTTGVTWFGGRTQLWIGFSDVEGEHLGVVATPFLRFETHQDVNCMMRIARGIESRIPDSTGAVQVVPMRDTSWFLFNDHPLGPQLASICRVFKQP